MDKKIKVLVVFANPRGTDPLHLGTEDRVIRESIKLSSHRENISLSIIHATTVHDLRRILLNEEFQIVHISGHGMDTGLVLEDEQGGKYVVPQQALADLFRAYCPPIECIILNACYSISQGKLTSLDVPFTIAMEGPISDNAAIEFSRGFYDAVGAGKKIDFAYEEGCRTFKLAAPNTRFISKILKKGGEIDYEPMFDSLLAEKSPELFAKLLEVRKIVIPVLGKIPNSLYSQDAEGHARQVLRLMSELYYPTLKVHLSAEELFIIGLLCLTHDIGMRPRENMADGYLLYQDHCQHSHDYIISLPDKYLDQDTTCKLAALCLVHNKLAGRAKAHLMSLETPNARLYLIFLMFRIADILEIELHPGALFRMAPNIITSTIGEFDIDSDRQTISLVAAFEAEAKYFEFWSQALAKKLEESKEEFSCIGLSYKVKIWR